MLNSIRFFAICFSALVLVGSGNVAAQVDGPESGPMLQEPQEVEAYWTPERIADAQAMPTPTVIITGTGRQPTSQGPELGAPATINGHPPGGGEYTPQVQTFPEAQAVMGPQAFGTGATFPTDYANYGKFQRWSMQGKYVSFPRSVHGKLFFSLNGGNFVCSATVANRSTIITAGHCVSDGAGNFAGNLYFCPAYNQGGENATFGCWTGFYQVVSNQWHNAGDPDRDYACIVMNTTGTVQANKIGNVTGWAGRGWNWGSANPEITFGYPQGAPFPGTIIQQTASVDWHEVDFTSETAPNPKSKVIGSDLTGGSSGGGWFLSWRHPNAEVADTDGNTTTDPVLAGNVGPYLNGVNSHKRCMGDCRVPPTASLGLFWQEMTSPPFWSSGDDINDSEDVFVICNNDSNNNP